MGLPCYGEMVLAVILAEECYPHLRCPSADFFAWGSEVTVFGVEVSITQQRWFVPGQDHGWYILLNGVLSNYCMVTKNIDILERWE